MKRRNKVRGGEGWGCVKQGGGERGEEGREGCFSRFPRGQKQWNRRGGEGGRGGGEDDAKEEET